MVSFNFRSNHGYLKPEVSAAIIFHHEWFEVERLAKEYFRFYPKGDLILARDHLPPILPVNLTKYNIKLIKSYSCMEPLINLSFNLQSTNDLSFKQKLNIVKNQIDRMYTISKKSKHDYVLVLEHDAKIRNRVAIFPGVDLEIMEHNPYPAELLRELHYITGVKPKFSGWGFVVGTVRRKCALSIKNWSVKNSKTLEKLVRNYPSMVYLDFLYPIITHLSGFVVSNNNLTVECKRDRFWFFRKSPLLHQYSGKKNSHRELASYQNQFN